VLETLEDVCLRLRKLYVIEVVMECERGYLIIETEDETDACFIMLSVPGFFMTS
jgi:hypothetical protein